MRGIVFPRRQGSTSSRVGFLRQVFTARVGDSFYGSATGTRGRPSFSDELRRQGRHFFGASFIRSFPIIMLTYRGCVGGRRVYDVFKIRRCGSISRIQSGSNEEMFPFDVCCGTTRAGLIVRAYRLDNTVPGELLRRVKGEVERFVRGGWLGPVKL